MAGGKMPSDHTKPQQATNFVGKSSERPKTVVHTTSAPKPGKPTFANRGGFPATNKGKR